MPAHIAVFGPVASCSMIGLCRTIWQTNGLATGDKTATSSAAAKSLRTRYLELIRTNTSIDLLGKVPSKHEDSLRNRPLPVSLGVTLGRTGLSVVRAQKARWSATRENLSNSGKSGAELLLHVVPIINMVFEASSINRSAE